MVLERNEYELQDKLNVYDISCIFGLLRFRFEQANPRSEKELFVSKTIKVDCHLYGGKATRFCEDNLFCFLEKMTYVCSFRNCGPFVIKQININSFALESENRLRKPWPEENMPVVLWKVEFKYPNESVENSLVVSFNLYHLHYKQWKAVIGDGRTVYTWRSVN